YITYDEGEERWLLLMLLHHLIEDFTTANFIRSELQVHLMGSIDQLPKPLPFRNFVAQARWGVSQKDHETFFRKMLGDVYEPTIPFGLAPVQGDGRGIGQAHMEVASGLARRLRHRARKLGVNVASLCHLAWAQVLARISGREDVVFGTVLFGRMHGGEGSDRVMGLFINTLPIRIKVGEEDVRTAVRSTHGALADLLRHEHASLALAQRCSGVMSPTPLFTVLLNYRHSAGASKAGAAEAVRAWEGIEHLAAEERTNYPLTLLVDDWEDGFGLTAQVQAPIDAMRICQYMHAALERLTEALEGGADIAISSLDVMPVAERRQVVEEWNATQREYPRDQCIH
ncbi:condensation domain-containing protein, partial [Dokdonella soli]